MGGFGFSGFLGFRAAEFKGLGLGGFVFSVGVYGVLLSFRLRIFFVFFSHSCCPPRYDSNADMYGYICYRIGGWMGRYTDGKVDSR